MIYLLLLSLNYEYKHTSGRSVGKAEGLAVNQDIGRNMGVMNIGLVV
jgi:hypothetical protein